MKSDWKKSLHGFFTERAATISGKPNLRDLCFVSGRDYRLWQDQSIYDDLIDNILSQAKLAPTNSVLEVGCAAGFLAYGIAPRVKSYVGVDVVKQAIVAAKKLELGNADFRVVNGVRLPFSLGEFDAAFCYDVFTNFPNISIGETIITEMLRVVKPGGHVLIGSVPDADLKIEFETRVAQVGNELNDRYGPVQSDFVVKQGLFQRLRNRFSNVEPSIGCYYFNKSDFISIAERLGVNVVFSDIHQLNPYKGLRFNAIFTKPI